MTQSFAALLELVEALDTLAIPYVVGGSVASTIHGEPRATADVDVMADLSEQHIAPLVARLEPSFYVDTSALREAVRRRSSCNLIHQESIDKVDLFVADSTPLDREQMRRRQAVTITTEPERAVYVTAPENIVLRKLDWYRSGGGVSDRQWRDVAGILKMQGRALDVEYMRDLAAQVGLTELLERALREASP